MKNILLLIILAILATSCHTEVTYPSYTLTTIRYIPDSLKKEHREWIKETIRASNQHLSAGDYEDIDETIIQAERTGDNLFEAEVVGLRKHIDDSGWNDIHLKPSDLTQYERIILDSLLNYK